VHINLRCDTTEARGMSMLRLKAQRDEEASAHPLPSGTPGEARESRGMGNWHRDLPSPHRLVGQCGGQVSWGRKLIHM